jgi:hypothetical protein
MRQMMLARARRQRGFRPYAGSAREIASQDPLAIRDCSDVTVHEWDAAEGEGEVVTRGKPDVTLDLSA